MENKTSDILRVQVITISDRASRGEYEDRSGARISELVRHFFAGQDRDVGLDRVIVPDEPDRIRQEVKKAVKAGTDIIFTSGGTGIGPRDLTPETVRPMLDKEIPGIMELVRVKYGMDKPHAVLSRSLAGVIGTSLIFCLPGSVRAVNEYLDELFPILNHTLKMVHGIDDH